MEAVKEEIGIAELVKLCGVDQDLYERTFFPKTVRQKTAPFHRRMNEGLEGPDRYVALMLFRGAGKTTKIRLRISKLIAYGLSRTIVVVGKSQDHSRKSIEWIMTQIEYNKFWAQVFQLKKGKKWTSEEIEIIHGAESHSIRVIALGITGSTRGINVDDFRPDTIIIDDPSDEENTNTPEQREKTDDFINGSLRNSLAPASEAPHAKMIFCQTLLHPEDSISRCSKDPLWKFLRFSVFDDKGESVWPDRWSTEELLAEKESFISRGKLHLWMREMECQVISNELSSFRPELLKYWDILPPKEETTYFMAIDPVPPPSDRELERGLKGKDWEVIAVIGRHKGNYFLAEYVMSQGHEPDWSIAKFFELKAKYLPMKARVEAVAYQRTLKWLLEKTMQRRGEWIQIDDSKSSRKKSYRIVDTIGSIVSQGKLYVHRSHVEFIEQYTQYPSVTHDDVIDCVEMALSCAVDSGGVYEGDFERLLDAERDIPDLVIEGGCP